MNQAQMLETLRKRPNGGPRGAGSVVVVLPWILVASILRCATLERGLYQLHRGVVHSHQSTPGLCTGSSIRGTASKHNRTGLQLGRGSAHQNCASRPKNRCWFTSGPHSATSQPQVFKLKRRPRSHVKVPPRVVQPRFPAHGLDLAQLVFSCQ